MSDESILRERAREVIRTGTLPGRRPDRMWGGPGAGADCAVCGTTVPRSQVEFEIEFFENGDESKVDKYHVHVRCFAVWELERHNAAVIESKPPTDGVGSTSREDGRGRELVSPCLDARAFGVELRRAGP
jgi:hypothetical protein